jgi:Holliday junction resolvase RusA-like endonuclease
VTFSFFVAGIPRTAGSKRPGQGTTKFGKTRIVDDSGERGRQWRKDVGTTALLQRAQQGVTEPIAPGVAVRLDLELRLPRPQKHLDAQGNVKLGYLTARPTSRPDTTKMLRAAEDALTGVLWYDDGQVVETHVRKVYTLGRREPAGALIRVAVL